MDANSNVKVTWSSHLFDVIKIRKRVNVLPLKVHTNNPALVLMSVRMSVVMDSALLQASFVTSACSYPVTHRLRGINTLLSCKPATTLCVAGQTPQSLLAARQMGAAQVELGMDWNRVSREYFPYACVRVRTPIGSSLPGFGPIGQYLCK